MQGHVMLGWDDFVHQLLWFLNAAYIGWMLFEEHYCSHILVWYIPSTKQQHTSGSLDAIICSQPVSVGWVLYSSFDTCAFTFDGSAVWISLPASLYNPAVGSNWLQLDIKMHLLAFLLVICYQCHSGVSYSITVYICVDICLRQIFFKNLPHLLFSVQDCITWSHDINRYLLYFIGKSCLERYFVRTLNSCVCPRQPRCC